MNDSDHRQRLLAFLATLPGEGLADGQDNLQLDSLALLQVVTYLETEYGIRLASLNLEPDDLRSVERIVSLIERNGA